ncbi:MAG: ABC transporter permease [Ilumatobacter sp.]|jgi:peptide/nickel transport system permease protein|uniref:ABC transporter permease n=1 Tax=Ilumatobacter sp. TaxID=1967498 RepID=UPI00391CD43B
MKRSLLGRLGGAALGLFVLTIVTFFMVRLLPGSVEDVMLGTENISPEVREAFRAKYGLDEPVVVQYLRWIGNLVQGDLGQSIRSLNPVTEELRSKLGPSLTLSVLGVTISFFASVGLGLVAALRRDRIADRLSTLSSIIGSSVPDFVVGLLLLIFVARRFDALPSFGYEPLSSGLWEWARHLILPVTAMSLSLVGIMTRLMRSSVLSTLEEDHVRTAIGKGLPRRRVLTHHVIRPSLIPVVTTAGLLFVAVIGGVVVIEYVFAIPGLGRLILESIKARDYPLIQGATLLIGCLAIIASIVVDLVHRALDPRIR